MGYGHIKKLDTIVKYLMTIVSARKSVVNIQGLTSKGSATTTNC